MHVLVFGDDFSILAELEIIAPDLERGYSGFGNKVLLLVMGFEDGLELLLYFLLNSKLLLRHGSRSVEFELLFLNCLLIE